MIVRLDVKIGVYGTFRKEGGALVWCPYDKDPTIWGTILRFPIFGNPHMGSLGM